MNRQAILESIDKHLSAQTADGKPLPIGDVVSRVAKELRVQKADPSTVVTVIPIEQVAAFVDGDLDPDAIAAVCRAVLVDNGVIAELVAASRALRTPVQFLPPVDLELTNRLLATHPVELISQKDIARMMHEPEVSTRRWRLGMLVPIVAVAALGWFLIQRTWDGSAGESSEVVAGAAGLVAEADPPLIDDSSQVVDAAGSDDSVAGEGGSLADSSPVTVPPTGPVNPTGPAGPVVTEAGSGTPDASAKADPNMGTAASPSGAPDSSQTDVLPAAVPEGTTPESSPSPPVKTPPVKTPPVPAAAVPMVDAVPVGRPAKTLLDESADRSSPPAKITSIQWNQISGLVGAVSVAPDAPPRFVVRRIAVEETFPLKAANRFVALRLSRAVAELNDGGQLILAPDSMATIGSGDAQVSAQMDVHYGEVAIQGVADGTVIRLRRGATDLGQVTFSMDGSLRISSVAGGMELQMQNARLRTDEGWLYDESIRLTSSGPVTIANPSSQTPSWYSQSPPTLSKVLLSQIGASKDLVVDLEAQINRLASSTRLTSEQSAELSKLVEMRVSLANSRVFELLGNRSPRIRQAAVEAIALLPKNDPRYEPVWAAIELDIADPQRRSELDQWMQLIRTGADPRPEQLKQMFAALKSPKAKVRGLADAMLRSYVNDPPPWDPQWDETQALPALDAYQDQVSDQ
ncbi:hypothetical protein K227x_48470 [Rubripirellula lacrimiformis]|uniref:Uncharacterized protein n=1 Tax=Rubripirellula lacrimiformis TaxID=1930273 RepID=A0A517NH29_9BACT|nr:hypothetical protein [Rubripirellula lacrimiformis]QDT06437.1 hypothetical protein K227x_48470 [Rubripirellula lacrimiformis]